MPAQTRRGQWRTAPKPIDHLINHVVLVLDCSASMKSNKRSVIQVADNEVKYLATRSQEMSQETRVSVYVFDDDVDCLVYDTDVLRLPSIASLYEIGGNTALIDATLTSIEELEKTATLHGDHSFLLYVLTDGLENRSRRHRSELAGKLNALADNWTLACFVPDAVSKREALQLGFNRDNVAVWDTTSTRGMDEVGNTVRAATENWMQARSTGVRGTRTLFSTGADAVNKATVSATLAPLDKKQYMMLPVRERVQTRPFVTSHGLAYVNGTVFYQLMKTEHVQPQKEVMVVEKATNKVYAGSGARDLIGLPAGMTVKVKPDYNDAFDVFVQSTAVNRNLIPGTTCVVKDPVKIK